eukprot:6205185-Pleurochrysis_carterae.AAC.3
MVTNTEHVPAARSEADSCVGVFLYSNWYQGALPTADRPRGGLVGRGSKLSAAGIIYFREIDYRGR